MNYRKLYLELINKAQLENGPVLYNHGRKGNIKNNVEGFEIHHIIPHSWGGSNSPQNLVRFTPKQHFTAHHLLARLCGGGMAIAFEYMSTRGGVKVTARQAETATALARKAKSNRMKGQKPMQMLTPEAREKVRLSLIGNQYSKGVKLSDEARARRSLARTGEIRSLEARKNISNACKNRVYKKLPCPYCGNEFQSNWVKRHSLTCKSKPM